MIKLSLILFLLSLNSYSASTLWGVFGHYGFFQTDFMKENDVSIKNIGYSFKSQFTTRKGVTEFTVGKYKGDGEIFHDGQFGKISHEELSFGLSQMFFTRIGLYAKIGASWSKVRQGASNNFSSFQQIDILRQYELVENNSAFGLSYGAGYERSLHRKKYFWGIGYESHASTKSGREHRWQIGIRRKVGKIF